VQSQYSNGSYRSSSPDGPMSHSRSKRATPSVLGGSCSHALASRRAASTSQTRIVPSTPQDTIDRPPGMNVTEVTQNL